jgi:hypothetical protein
VTEVQEIEAAVGDDEFFAAGANLFALGRQIVPRDKFVTEIHAAILSAPRHLATL